MKIPKVFHQIWMGDKPIPDIYDYYRDTWLNLHPDWGYKFWDDNNLPVDDFTNKELYLSDDGAVFRSDIARIEILNLRGGVYIDGDFECYQNIEPLIQDYPYFFSGEQPGIIGNAIIGSTPNNPILKHVLEGMPENASKEQDYAPNIRVGVVYITKTLANTPLIYLPSKLFYPTLKSSPPNRSSDYPEAYANHHFKGSWVGVEGRKDYGVWKRERKSDSDWLEQRKKVESI